MDFFTYTVPQQGEVAASVTAVQLPDRKCKGVIFNVKGGVATKFYIGGAGVTIPDGSTDQTGGIELTGGQSTPILPCTNLNVWFVIADVAVGSISYLILT